MYQIQQITADARQKQRFVLYDGSIVTIEIEFKPMQLGWFITSLQYGEFILDGVRICVSPNMLHQYINQLPFGICVTTINNQEPQNQQDFVSGFCTMYFLDKTETQYYLKVTRGEA
jgi:hypothetical protein